MSKTPREILEALSQQSVDESFVLDDGTGSQLYKTDKDRLVSAALADLKEAVLSAVGEDDWDKSEHDELRNLKHKVRNEHRAEIRKAILTMFEGE